jgi:uncharacterized protein (DUF58 family)
MFRRPRHPRSHLQPPGARKAPSLDFSYVGLLYTGMMFFMGLAAMNSQANLLFAVFGLMIGVLFISGIISRLVLRRLEIRRHLPDHLVAGRQAFITYEFMNQKRFWPSFSVTLGELSASESFAKQPQAYMLHAAAGMRATVPMQVLPRRRGLHQLDRFQLITSFPFGFIRRAVDRRQKDSILVYPPIAQVEQKLLQMCLSAESAGATMRPRRGGTDEFYGVKEFRTGENPRWIYWRRSARTGTLVAKEMTRVAPPSLLVLVDSFAADGSAQEQAEIERTIAMAGSLVSRAIDEGITIGLIAFDGGWTALPARRGKRHGRDLMALLARLPRNTTRDRVSLLEAAQPRMRPGTTAVLFTPREFRHQLSEYGRSNWIVLSSLSPQAQCHFRFDADIDFSQCMPADQAVAGK